MAKLLCILTLSSFLNSILGAQFGRQCKTVPGSPSWPTAAAWDKLNQTLSGSLIATIPPGAVCHPEQLSYNNTTCTLVSNLWTTSWAFHSDNPVSLAENTWSNDSCLPYPQYPCSSTGYPVYVVNASKPEHVQAGINFARVNNIRLVVKGSSHDFRGRAIAPYSISIWTRFLRGLSYNDDYRTCGSFPPQDLNTYDGPVMTIAAGEDHAAAFAFANNYGKMIHVAGAGTVGFGGYLTGGGQSMISLQKGIAVDAVLEISMVLPSGEIITANACQNPDIFWAVRGGGGSTFGVILSFTVKVFQSERLTSVQFGFESTTLEDNKFWEAMKYMAAQFPVLSNAAITVYSSLAVASAANPTLFRGTLFGLNQTAAETITIVQPLAEHFNASYGSDIQSQLTGLQEWASFYDWWLAHQDAGTPLGLDLILGSRLLDEKSLNHPNFTTIMKRAAGENGIAFNVVAGPGTHAYASDFNAASPGWRTSYVHAIVGDFWAPFNETAKDAAIARLTYGTTGALRELAPDTGSYLNEAAWPILMNQISNEHFGVPTIHAYSLSNGQWIQKMYFGVRRVLETSGGRILMAFSARSEEHGSF